MITKLTKKQEAKFQHYVKKWTEIGLSTHKSDDAEITKIVKEIYKVSNLKEPEVIIVDSIQQAIDMGCKSDADRYVKGWVGWSAWVDFFKTECGVEVKNDLESELAKHCLMYWVYEGKSFVVRNPVEINQDEQHRLHSYTRPSMLFANGDCLCHFSGIKVPMKYVKAKTFTKEEVLSEPNVDIRREMVAKIGISEAERILGADKIDTLKTAFGGTYELLMIDYKGNGDKKPYLKMKNPSIGKHHIEGVIDSAKNVKEAIMYRMNLNAMPNDCEISEVT